MDDPKDKIFYDPSTTLCRKSGGRDPQPLRIDAYASEDISFNTLFLHRLALRHKKRSGGNVNRVARFLSSKYLTLLLDQTIELLTHVLSSMTINIIPDTEPKYRIVWLNTEHLTTLNVKVNFSKQSLTDP